MSNFIKSYMVAYYIFKIRLGTELLEHAVGMIRVHKKFSPTLDIMYIITSYYCFKYIPTDLSSLLIVIEQHLEKVVCGS